MTLVALYLISGVDWVADIKLETCDAPFYVGRKFTIGGVRWEVLGPYRIGSKNSKRNGWCITPMEIIPTVKTEAVKNKKKEALAMQGESLESQIDRLAKFIVEEIPGEPSQDEGAIDTAIRLINKLKESCVTLQELLVKERAEKKHTLFDLSILGK